jgi:uncharacterized protein YjiS (DUF1127 family)
MAAVEMTRPAPLGAITTYRAINGLSNAMRVLAAWNDARVTRKALNKLSDRELDDIGLCRGDIEGAKLDQRAFQDIGEDQVKRPGGAQAGVIQTRGLKTFQPAPTDR